MPIWLLLLFVALIAFTAYEVWLARTQARVHIGMGGEVSKSDAPRMFTVYRAGYWIGLILLSVLTPMFVIVFGVKI